MELLNDTAIIATALGGIGIIWKFLISFARAYTLLHDIREQFTPNGGTSLRDAVDRIESTLQDHTYRLDKLEA